MSLHLHEIRFLRTTIPALVALAVLAGCGKPQALGDANAVIIGMPEAEWAEFGAEVEEALEPRVFAVRDERIFRVTPVDPTGPYWGDTRRFRQVLVIGEAADAWVAQVLREAGERPAQLPAIVQTQNVWSRGQRVTAIVLPPGAPATAARPLLEPVGEAMLRDYQTFIRQRMFASGADTPRADSLLRQEGFYLVAPAVYRTTQLDPETYQFINDQPDPAQLQRSVLVTWREDGDRALGRDEVLEWRQAIAQRFYQPPQVTERERVEETGLDANAAGLEVQGVWSSPPGAWPAAGPFLTRVHHCPDGRTYLIDGWVYAPGREKYEYLYQLQTILDSFRCAPQRA